MAAISMQKQSSRNLVLSANAQAAYGGVLADANLTQRQRFDPSSVFEISSSRRNDKSQSGKGSEFATSDQITAWMTKGTVKSEADTWLLGWMLAFIFGQDAVVGAGPFTHTFTSPNITATMPCTTVYVEETVDVHRHIPDMAATSFTLDVPERGSLSCSLDLVGTGRWIPGSMNALPALVTASYLLGSDFLCTITPAGGAAVPFSGRQKNLSIKVDRSASAYQASGDGLYAGSVASGDVKFSVSITVAAEQADDVNGWFEQGIPLSIALATNPANQYQCGFIFPIARVKANKLTNTESKVTWALQFDETTCLQNGNQPAISAFIINQTPAYLVPA